MFYVYRTNLIWNTRMKHFHPLHITNKLECDPLQEEYTYFNNSGKTPLPPSVQQAGLNAILREANPWLEQESYTESIRTLFASLIGTEAINIAIVPSTGFALTLAAHNLKRVRERLKKVLIVQDEMSSEVYCWQEMEDVELVVVPHPDLCCHYLDVQDEARFLSSPSSCCCSGGFTQLIVQTLNTHSDIDCVCLPQVHWSDGSYIDLTLISSICRQRNIPLIVDGTQSVGIMPFHVPTIQPDVLAVSVHKWLLGPHAMSLVYVHPKHHNDWKPLDQHERSRVAFQNEIYDAQEDNITTDGYPNAFVNGAARLDSGGKKNPILEPMVCEALKIVTQLDLSDAQSRLKILMDAVLVRGRAIGFSVQCGPRANHIIGLRPFNEDIRQRLTPETMVDIKNRLWKRRIYLAVRNGAFRISPWLNTTMEDVDRLMSALDEECKINYLK
jgi:selenocysteine lyase/cysteine desulfurase